MNCILDALSSLNVADLSYQEWINVGMALKREGFPVQVWDSWSRNDPTGASHINRAPGNSGRP